MRLILAFLLCSFLSKANTVRVVTFSELETILQKKDDTLRVINFWATWCKPCVEELPFFEKLNQMYQDQPVKVILVSLDFSNKKEMVASFVQRKNLQSSVLLLAQSNPNEWIDKVSPDWSGAIPATLFVRGSHAIRIFHEGEYTQETLDKQIQNLLSIKSIKP
jgi:thiol-disulfide isomerase/thioredoxin